jgi:hypothetical protein
VPESDGSDDLCWITIVTLSGCDINELHIGLKGTMDALYFRDLADKRAAACAAESRRQVGRPRRLSPPRSRPPSAPFRKRRAGGGNPLFKPQDQQVKMRLESARPLKTGGAILTYAVGG